jgi:hypothetical protein
LDLIRHKRILAMLQEWGLSGQQAAAPLPSVAILDPKMFMYMVEMFWCSTTVVQQYLAMGRYQVSEPAAAMAVEQRAAYRELLRITQTGALMLLEAAHNLLECEPQLAANASEAAVACALCTMVQSTGVTTTSSSNSSATAEQPHGSNRAEMHVAAADDTGGAAAGSRDTNTGSSSSSSSIHAGVTDFELAQVVRLVS